MDFDYISPATFSGTITFRLIIGGVVRATLVATLPADSYTGTWTLEAQFTNNSTGTIGVADLLIVGDSGARVSVRSPIQSTADLSGMGFDVTVQFSSQQMPNNTSMIFAYLK